MTELTKPTGQDCPRVAKHLGLKRRPKKPSECIIKSYPGWKSVFAFTLMLSSVLVAQSCPTLCDPSDYSPPGSSLYGILQARILEWVAISFSSSFQADDQKQVNLKERYAVRETAQISALASPFSWQQCAKTNCISKCCA